MLIGLTGWKPGALEPVKNVNPLLLTAGRRKRFGNGSSDHFSREANLWIISGVVGPSAVAGRFSATARDRADRPWAQIAKRGEVTEDLGAFGFLLRQRIRHRWQLPNPECI